MTETEVADGAILIAHLVAVDFESVSTIGICPVDAGWTLAASVPGNDAVVQFIWWRSVTAAQTAAVSYTFESRADGSCSTEDEVVTALTGAISVYSGVATDSPIGVVASSSLSDQGVAAIAPEIAASQPAGSRVLRFLGIDNDRELALADSSLRYSVGLSTEGGPRRAALYDGLLSAEGPVAEQSVGFRSRSRWVATTVVLREPSESAPTDTTPPQTTASSPSYVAGTWTNATAVDVVLSASDAGGSGVSAILYSLAGSQTQDLTTVPGATANVSITAEGETTISYFAHDVAGNDEVMQTFVVRIDRSGPSLSGAPTTAPNGDGWYSGDVTIAWTCSDGVSGIAGSCPAESVIGGEGENLSAGATVRDIAGNERVASVAGINIDRTAPVTTIEPPSGWSNSPVTVTFSADDNLSGVQLTSYTVDDGPEQSGGAVTFDQSGRYSLRYWSVDNAGNREEAKQVEILIDRDAPHISHTLSSEPNAYGWHTAPVTVTFTCEDTVSEIVSCSDPQTLATDGESQTVTGTAVDAAGNVANDAVSLKIDQTPPVITASRTPAANASGWNATSVTVSAECSDATSGIRECPAAETIDEGANQQVTLTAIDVAGNSTSATVSGINVDLTAPTITATATTPDGATYLAGSWASQPVTVTFSCSDVLSDIASCPEPQVFGEGAAQSAAGTAEDIARNQASAKFGPINIDLTAPTIQAVLTTAGGDPYTPGDWANGPVTVTFVCDDALSLVATCSEPVTLGDGIGQRVTGTVTDVAGLTASVTIEQINIDSVAPTITATATTADGRQYVSGLWTNQPVTVSFACVESLSGLAQDCPEPIVVSDSTPIAGQAVSAGISDRAGNAASSDVIVVMLDRDAPRFTFVPDDQRVEVRGVSETVVNWPDPTAVDDLSGTSGPVCLPASGAIFGLGETPVTCTATDGAGNVATAAFTVTVIDVQPPDLNIPDNMTVPADGPQGAVVHYSVGGEGLRIAAAPDCTPASGSRFQVGTTVVECHASNPSGVSATGSFTVTVLGASDLLGGLRGGTIDAVSDRTAERALLRTLDQVDVALRSGNSIRAVFGMLQFWIQVDLYARHGRIAAVDLRQLHTGVRQVIDAIW
ncbi:MAG TPA: HYR domain-containing protein [Thermomicrobiales bacterium]|nr:HYR domain-containing protein [Thermomicrobiales bacterium]